MEDNKPRAWTPEEARDMYLRHIKEMVRYWATVDMKDHPNKGTVLERLDGLAYGILTMFDGEHGSLPAVDIRLAPQPSDEDYCKSENRNWFNDQDLINNEPLHEHYEH